MTLLQIDLPKGVYSGLDQVQAVLRGIPGIEMVYLTDKDVVRHELVSRIIRAYDNSTKNFGKRRNQVFRRTEKPGKPNNSNNSAPSGNGKRPGRENDNNIQGLAEKLKPRSHVLVWAAITFVVTFAIFLISLVPPQVELKVGEVSPIDVRATKEVVDEAATEALRAEVIAGVSEVYDSNPRVLDEIKVLFDDLLSKIGTLAAAEDISTQDIVREIRPFVPDSVSDTDIIGLVATSPAIVETSINKAQQIVEDILSRVSSPRILRRASKTRSPSLKRMIPSRTR